MSALSDIERDLKTLLRTNRKAWVESFRMMEKVKKEELWFPAYRSFSAWLTMISEETRIHVSVLWERLQAGEFYLRYAKSEETAGRPVPVLEKAGVGVEKLKYILRIASGDTVRARPLIEKAKSGELTGLALRQAWKAEKADRLARGEKIGFLNGYDREKSYAGSGLESESPGELGNLPLPSDLLMALASSCSWLPEGTLSSVYAEAYEVFPELTLAAGSASAVKFDAVVVESLTLKHMPDRVALHGFVIANSLDAIESLAMPGQQQRLRLIKSHADFLWILVPEALEAPACSLIEDEQAGILSLKGDDSLEILQAPSRLSPEKRAALLEALLLKSVKKVRSAPKGGAA